MNGYEKDSQKTTKAQNISTLGIFIFSLIGLAVASYLFIIHYLPTPMDSLLFQICSLGTFNCEKVNSSQYSVLFGFPIAGYGIIYYVSIMLIMLVRKVVLKQNIINGLLLLFTAVGAFMVFPLFVISTFVIKTFCLYCIIAWICNFMIFGMTLFLFEKYDSLKQMFFGLINNMIIEFREDTKKALMHIVLLVLLVFISILTTGFFSYALHAKRQYVRFREQIFAQQEAFDEYIRRSPRKMNLAGLPVYYGNPAAKVSIVEYMNFDCGVCRKASSVIKSIVDKYPGKVKLFLKHYPLDGACNKYVLEKGDGLSCRASLIAIALQNTPHYHEYVNQILSSNKKLSRELVLDVLKSINVDTEKLRSYLDEKIAIKILEEHIESAAQFNIEGTPSFIINGKSLPTGLPPVQFLERIIKFEIYSAYGEK